MKQLNIFIDKLSNSGMAILTMWESKLKHGGVVRTCVVSKGNNTTTVMFLIYEGDNGFDVFSCVSGNDMDKSVDFFQNLLK